jgi:hypothetical protein
LFWDTETPLPVSFTDVPPPPQIHSLISDVSIHRNIVSNFEFVVNSQNLDFPVFYTGQTG